jgi:hypothetical protein
MKLRYQLLWGAALALSMGCSATLKQPCTVGRGEGGSYLAVATLTSAAGTCDDANKGWDIDATHFTFDVEKFGDTATDFGKHIAILPDYFQSPTTAVHAPGTVAIGDLTSDFSAADPDANNLATCTVPTMTAAVDGAESFTFSNVKFLTEPGYQGAEVAFDLAYTDLAGCTANYSVLALQPALGCAEDRDCHWDTIATDPTCNTVTQMLSNIPAHCNLDIGACEITGTFPVTGPGYSCASAAKNNGAGDPYTPP